MIYLKNRNKNFTKRVFLSVKILCVDYYFDVMLRIF